MILAELRTPDRGWDTIVVGEPARAFYGNQFSLTFPVIDHYGVELWVPEVGGRVNPGSEAHEMLMSVFGGMSKGERTRIKMRVQTAVSDMAEREGRFLGGRPPYGYRLTNVGPHPNPEKAAVGMQLHQLEPDPVTAPVVGRIFTMYLAGAGFRTIAHQLAEEGTPSPSACDRQRNAHRSGRGWAFTAVRSILENERYMARQVWGRQPATSRSSTPAPPKMATSRPRNGRTRTRGSAHRRSSTISSSTSSPSARSRQSSPSGDGTRSAENGHPRSTAPTRSPGGSSVPSADGRGRGTRPPAADSGTAVESGRTTRSRRLTPTRRRSG